MSSAIAPPDGVKSYYPASGTGYTTSVGIPAPAYPVGIMTAKPADQAVVMGEEAVFSAEVYEYNDVLYSYFWYEYATLSDAQNDTTGTAGTVLSDDSVYSGTETDTLTVKAGSSVDGKYYKFFVQDSIGVLTQPTGSDPAKLTVLEPISITAIGGVTAPVA